MDTKTMIQIALCALEKNMDYETLYYSDYMYGKESFTESVYDYVVEGKDMGMLWFRTNYAEYL